MYTISRFLCLLLTIGDNSLLSDLHFYVHVSSFPDGEAQIRYLVFDEEVRNLRIALRLYDGPRDRIVDISTV